MSFAPHAEETTSFAPQAEVAVVLVQPAKRSSAMMHSFQQGRGPFPCP